MASLLISTLFLAAFAFAIHAIVATVRPRLDRIMALLAGTDAVLAPLPIARAPVRGAPVRVRSGSAQATWRAAA